MKTKLHQIFGMFLLTFVFYFSSAKAQTTVFSIIANSPNHTTLEAALIAAKLDDDLSGTGPFTVFAPTDAAFNALPAGTLTELLKDPTGTLAQILLYHVASGKVLSTSLTDEQIITTLQGKTVKVDISSAGVFINNAKVTTADLSADNGVVHVIDAVLLPPAKAAFPIDFETTTGAVWTVFENGTGAPDDFAEITNPDKTGINTSGNVLKFKVNTDAKIFAGAVSESYAPVEITQNSHIFTMMVWKSIISPVGFKLEGSTNGGADKEVKVSNTQINKWEKITFDLTAAIGFNYKKIVIFPDFPATRTSGTTVYIDNIEKRAPNTVVDIIVNSPVHTTLETAVIAAKLDDDLSGPGPFTVFAPTDAAFNALPAGTLTELLKDPTGALAQILLYHVANGKVLSTSLTDEQIITTLQGKTVKVDITAAGVFINNAKVTVADVLADNGVVHVIDAVLLPPADKAKFPIDFETVTDAVWTVFENGTGAADDFKVIPNPDKTGINTSGNVLKFKVNSDAKVFAGAVSESYAPVEITQNSHTFTMMVWKSIISPVGFKLEGSTNGGADKEVKVSNTQINKWEKITFDLTAAIGFTYKKIVIFPDFPETRTGGTTVYIDNIEKKLPATVVDIIVNSPVHTTLETAVIAAKLDDDLSGPGPFTVFAPTDAAFNALPAGTLTELLKDPTGALAQILLYHVASGKVLSSSLTDEQIITTLQGKTVKVDITAAGVFINNAKVTVADILADNGVVHVIDAVLLPPADKAKFPIDFETVTDAVWTVFENGTGAADDFKVIPNPDKTGINASGNVLKFKVNSDAKVFAGAVSESYAPVEITQNSHVFTMMVWKSIISPVGFKLEGSTNGGADKEVKVSNTQINKWEKITFDLTAAIGFTYKKIVFFPDFPETRTGGTTVYIDNIEKLNVTAVRGFSSKSLIKVYPNPAVDVLNVILPDAKAQVTIYNNLGKLVESAIIEGKEGRFDVSNYSPGLYFLRVNGGPAVKFIK